MQTTPSLDDSPPPGVPPERMTPEQLRLLIIALDGLAARLIHEREQLRAGSRGYHQLAEPIGRVQTTRAQLARLLPHEHAA